MLYKRLAGLVLLSISVGMFLIIFLPTWAFFLAAIFAVLGVYLMFFGKRRC
ncbi:MAG: hypothetical protein FWD82_02450 [Defluviitaleaceae bacterium]|nr:hypothetical protein [Defluviitaleaceae bacterium]